MLALRTTPSDPAVVAIADALSGARDAAGIREAIASLWLHRQYVYMLRYLCGDFQLQPLLTVTAAPTALATER